MKICNLCGGKNLKTLLNCYNEKPSPHMTVYFYCKDCGFVTLDLDYEKWIPSYEDEFKDLSELEKRRNFFQCMAETWVSVNASNTKSTLEIYETIIQGKGKSFLDIGTGWGGALSVFKQMGWEVYGLEPGKTQAEYCKTEHFFDVRSEFYEQASFTKDFADFINCYHVLEHTDKPWKVFKNLNYHLKLGGMAYLEVPNISYTMRPHLGFGHISMFTPDILKALLKIVGFEILHVHDRGPTAYGVFAKKSKELKECGINEEHEFIPKSLIQWSKSNYLKLRIGIHHAFFLYTQERSIIMNLHKLVVKEWLRHRKKLYQ